MVVRSRAKTAQYRKSLGNRSSQKVWEVSWDLWDHRNEMRLSTLSPTNRKIIEDLNAQISVEFAEGTTGLGHRDHHWLEKPLAHVIGYDKDHSQSPMAGIL